MVAQRYLSPTNTHLPVATGTVVGFVRDRSKFKLNNYCQFVETPSVTGLYYRLDPDHPARVVAKSEFVWQPGADAPQGHTNIGDFDMVSFALERLAYPFSLEEEAVAQAQMFAGWDPLEYEAKSMAQQAMTVRTMDVWSTGGTLNLDNPANWPTTNTAPAYVLANQPNTQTWANSTVATSTIKQSLLNAARVINQLTNGVVEPTDMMVVISPTAAVSIAAAPEILDFVKQQASAPQMMEKGWGNPNELWGLPSNLWGFPLHVESTPFVNTYPVVGGNVVTPGTRLYAKADNYAAMVSRPGGIDAPFGSRSFSTIQCYWHRYDMSVEALFEPWHKKHRGRVVDYRTFITPALTTGFLIQNILS